MSRARELVAYVDGRIVPLNQAMAKMSESESSSPGGLYDTQRTFKGEVFKLREHLQRLYNSLAFARMDPGISMEEMESMTLEVLDTNRPLLKEREDFILGQVVSMMPNYQSEGLAPVTVLIYCQFIDFSKFAHGYAKGIRIVTPATYGVPPSQEDSREPAQETCLLMEDSQGNITECNQANFFLVQEGRIKLPNRERVLPGVSMETVLELAELSGIPVDEGNYCSFDAYGADEAFVTGTRYCLLPVATFNGVTLTEDVPGPITRQILDAWTDTVRVDLVHQALDHPSEPTAEVGPLPD